uniref:Chemosensory protein n=1 Tax=Cacopsylla melanoneura TaxID=428564 RepID=A0A8D8UYY6_9HEMI
MESKVVMFCLVGVAVLLTPSMGYEFEGEEAFDCEQMMKNERVLNGIVDCLKSDDAECGTIVFTKIKELAPEIMQTVCGKCTDAQKAKFKICTNEFIKLRPEDYDIIAKKLDPENKFRGPMEEFLKS